MKWNWNILACCLNWKVILGAIAVGGAVLVVAPNLAPAALPLLLAAICPLSMLVMMWGMRGGQGMHGGQGMQKGMSRDPGVVGTASHEEEVRALRARIDRVQRGNEMIASALAGATKQSDPGDGVPPTIPGSALRRVPDSSPSA